VVLVGVLVVKEGLFRFLRRGGGGETTPAAGRELVGILGRAGGPVLGTLVASAALVGVASAGALTLALHSLALAGAAGLLALAALAWPVLHVAARVVLLQDAGPGAAWRGVGDALRALAPTYLPGRRSWRRAVWLGLWGLPAVLLPQLALVPLWMILPASFIGAVLLPLQIFVFAATLDVVALAWSFGYLSGAAEERARARLEAEEEAGRLPPGESATASPPPGPP